MNTTLAAKVGGGAVILTGTGVGGTYIATKDSIWNQVKSICLPENVEENDAWKTAQNKLISTEDSATISKEFKELKQQITSSTSEDKTTGKLMKKGCSSFYSQNYKSAFSSYKENDQFITDIKTYCSITIKELIGAENLISETTQTTVWTAAQDDKLKTITDQTEKDKLIGKFKELNELLTKTGSTPPTAEQGLKPACAALYIQKYQGSDEDKKTVIQIKKHCSYTIKEKLEKAHSGKTFEEVKEKNTDTDALKTKMEAITTPTNSTNEEFKEKGAGWKTGKEDASKQKEFRTWCQKLYATQWDGKSESEESDYKLAHTYCKKD